MTKLWRIVPAMGVSQIIGWGSLYYSIAVLAAPMAQNFDCDKSWIFGAFSLALLISGLAAPHVGHAIDKLGGRRVMSWGAVLAAAALSLIAVAPSLALFFIGWMLAGLAMSMTLYDAAFPALSQVCNSQYRRALTALTLFGGMASTAFWPLAWQLFAAFGWRITLLFFAALNIVVCLPLYRWALRVRDDQATVAHDIDMAAASLSDPKAQPIFWLASALALNAFMFSAVGAHVLAMLSSSTRDAAQAVWLAAMIGPMQVLGRVLEFFFASKRAARQLGSWIFLLSALAMLLLWQAAYSDAAALLFVLVYGMANGVMTIVRGMVPAEIFGRAGYGLLMGRLARPALFAKASAPLTLAMLLSAGTSYAMLAWLLTALCLAACVCYQMAIRAPKSVPLVEEAPTP